MYTLAFDDADSFIVSVERLALLSAVRWSVARAFDTDPAFAKLARRTGEFLLSPENKAVELNCPVSDFANSSNECAFKLLVRL